MENTERANILMVDDRPANLVSLEMILSPLGHNLVKANSGSDALRYLLQQDFAVILLDVNMPLMDGFETASLVRGRDKSRHIPIIFLTATTRSDLDLFKGYSLGAVDYIFKPIIPEILKSKVTVFVELYKKTKELELLRENERREHEQERMRNIEALRQSEEQYRLLFENNPLPMWVYELESLNFLKVNEAAIKHYGYSREEFLSMTIKDIRPPEDIPLLLEKVSRVSPALQMGTLVRHRKKDGTLIDVEITSNSISFGGKRARLVMSTDITEKKQLEAQYLRAQRMESIGTLASGIAHDLNNVLAPIILSTEILKKHVQNEQGKKVLDTIERTAQRGADLVKQVLSFGRGHDGETTIIQLKHIIREIEKVTSYTFDKSIQIKTDITRDLWTISGNPTQLHQVLMNLCVNARDAMAQEGGTLTISTSNFFIDENYTRLHIDARVGPYIVITITDTGSGISPEILDKIFDPFFTTKGIGQGTGLGLSTVLSIVKRHGGFINVYSELGEGTQFKIYFPAAITEETELIKEEYSDLPTGQGRWILVVDDEASIREITRSTLEAYDYNVLTASDGIEAIAVYSDNKEKVSAVIIDIMMPDMDGITSIRTLQKIDPLIKVIAVSGFASEQKLGELNSIGIQTFLLKPFTAEELLKQLCGVMPSTEKSGC